MTLPTKYAWLAQEPGPKMLLEMLKLFGTQEVLGDGDNAEIISWAKEIGETEYKHDITAWCGLTIGISAKRAGWDSRPQGNALWARNWATWGTKAEVPMLGDVLVFPRGPGGHVALYIGEDLTHYHILGGNQSDCVCIVRKAKTPLLAARRAPWRIAQPVNVRRVYLTASGTRDSGKEA